MKYLIVHGLDKWKCELLEDFNGRTLAIGRRDTLSAHLERAAAEGYTRFYLAVGPLTEKEIALAKRLHLDIRIVSTYPHIYGEEVVEEPLVK